MSTFDKICFVCHRPLEYRTDGIYYCDRHPNCTIVYHCSLSNELIYLIYNYTMPITIIQFNVIDKIVLYRNSINIIYNKLPWFEPTNPITTLNKLKLYVTFS